MSSLVLQAHYESYLLLFDAENIKDIISVTEQWANEREDGSETLNAELKAINNVKEKALGTDVNSKLSPLIAHFPPIRTTSEISKLE